MKFIHVADVHLGINPDADKPWSKDRAYDIKETFENVIEKCKEVNCDLLLIAGDLFHRQPLIADLNEVNDLFKTIPYTHVVIIAGECDRIKENSAVLGFTFNENVHYITAEFPTELEIEDLNVVIHGFSYHAQEISMSYVDSISFSKDDRTHILIAHGGDLRHIPIDYTLLQSKGFTYCALWHLHQYQVIEKDSIIYPGSLEPLSVNEAEEHGIIIGEINTLTKTMISTDFVPMAKVQYFPLKITINENITTEQLIESIENVVKERGVNNIYKLRLEGSKSIDMDFEAADLDDSIKIAEFIDNTIPKYDFVKLSKEHPQDMIGAFIRSFNNTKLEDMSETERKALFYGINALLKTSDK